MKPHPQTEETKRKISAANKGNKSKLGQHISEETKQKIGNALRGRHFPKISQSLLGRKRPSISKLMQREGNHEWKGDAVSWQAAHFRTRKLYPVIPEGYERHHIDGNPRNNSPENIKIVTRQEHMLIDGRLNQERDQYGKFQGINSHSDKEKPQC